MSNDFNLGFSHGFSGLVKDDTYKPGHPETPLNQRTSYTLGFFLGRKNRNNPFSLEIDQ